MKNKQFAVIGLGRFGTAVTKTLVENGYDVVIKICQLLKELNLL